MSILIPRKKELWGRPETHPPKINYLVADQLDNVTLFTDGQGDSSIDYVGVSHATVATTSEWGDGGVRMRSANSSDVWQRPGETVFPISVFMGFRIEDAPLSRQSLWIGHTGTSNNAGANGKAYLRWDQDNKKMQFLQAQQFAWSSTVLTDIDDGEFHDVALTITSATGTATVYLDGSEVLSADLSSNSVAITGTHAIGSEGNGTGTDIGDITCDYWHEAAEVISPEFCLDFTENPYQILTPRRKYWVAGEVATALNNNRISAMHFQRHYEPIAMGD